ncbi:MAG: hypothetical protein RDV48_01645 [Candidatus Eremiobacteraeota bacterium]|nr:hypothetical protein [Candidatus Eremiobacteraeota bacterium]
MNDPIAFNPALSSSTGQISPQDLAEIRQRQVERERRTDDAASGSLMPVEQITPGNVQDLQAYYNKTLDAIDQIRYPGAFPNLDEKAVPQQGQGEENSGAEESLDTDPTGAVQNNVEAGETRPGVEANAPKDVKKTGKAKEKKKLDIEVDLIFTPLIRAGDVATPGRNIAHFDVQIKGKDADKVDQQAIKQSAMRLMEKNSGKSMGIPGDGNLKADSLMKILFIAGQGKLEGGQRVLSVQGLDGNEPFKTLMKEEGGDELQKAQQYLRDNPDAPDAEEVKKRIEKLEKQRASGVMDFSLEEPQEPEEEKDRNKKPRE